MVQQAQRVTPATMALPVTPETTEWAAQQVMAGPQVVMAPQVIQATPETTG